MDPKPKYLLKYSGKEIESNDLDQLLLLAKNLIEYYEIFRVYKAKFALERRKSILTQAEIEDSERMDRRGYSRDVMARKMGRSRFYIDKVLDKLPNSNNHGSKI